MFSFKNRTGNLFRRLVPDFILFFEKALHEVKASGQHISSKIFWYSSTLTYIKKGLGLVFSQHFVHDFSKKKNHVN